MNKYLPIVVAILVSVGGAWYVSQLNKFTIPEPPISEEAQVQKPERVSYKPAPTLAERGITVVESGNMKLVTDLQTGISFSYPSEWGAIGVSDEGGECPSTMTDPCNFRFYMFSDLETRANIFLATETLGHTQYPIGRGAFWGDSAGGISQSLAIECARSSKCEPFINPQGTIIAKRMIYDYDDELESDGSNKMVERLGYYVFSDKGPYYGIILSAARFSEPGDKLEKQFEETVVSSLKLFAH